MAARGVRRFALRGRGCSYGALEFGHLRVAFLAGRIWSSSPIIRNSQVGKGGLPPLPSQLESSEALRGQATLPDLRVSGITRENRILLFPKTAKLQRSYGATIAMRRARCYRHCYRQVTPTELRMRMAKCYRQVTPTELKIRMAKCYRQVTPTELKIRMAKCYRQVTPTELRMRMAKLNEASSLLQTLHCYRHTDRSLLRS